MSFTTTHTPTKTLTRTSSIYLASPSKRRRIGTSGENEATHLRPNHTTKQIYSWTFRSEAVALCSVNHALTMRADEAENYDFYWLGSVPCRSVKVVGMVVGVVTKDNKVIYTVDDGTGVIDCSHTHKVAQPPPTDTLSKYKAPVELPKDLVPLVNVGGVARFQGRLRPLHESRQIVLDDVTPCPLNDELQHAKTVRHLYKTVYSRKEPFVIPEPPPATPKKKPVRVVAETPTSPATVAASSPIKPQSSPISSPVKSVTSDSSPVKPLTHSPIKLRHPSRLHTHDLTDNTFRIYVKHYMSHAPLIEDDDDDEHAANHDDDVSQVPTTPTKRRRAPDDTPRQRPYGGGCSTPRPRIEPINFGTKMPASIIAKDSSNPDTVDNTTTPQLKGFTLSYLRRVPELSLLASRVVEAVARRHYREERKRLKERSSSSRTKPPSSASSSSSGVLPPAKFAEKKKRLFKWAVIELLHEGGIALWDGPVRRCPPAHARAGVGELSKLWKASTSTSMTSDSSLFGNTTTNTTNTTTSNLTSSQQDLEDEEAREYLSDPSSTHAEESYVPLTPPYLASAVENAISVLVAHYASIGRPYAGATKEGILSVLRKDDRWRFVGDWSVEETLVWLKERGRVWKMPGVGGAGGGGAGSGRWDLTA
ncbi:hypothetical protein D9619_007926 [Psilocybe cf. subviscida]|uniref:CST complex subunit STN1 n=1 Tax=Psilocybe cf. subviscida TaxID=2480587 RepID=A0A8H5ATT9_9AGAR|nr:hypothetical protein D9619_007926 [Psilocybe cf. subviscida]